MKLPLRYRVAAFGLHFLALAASVYLNAQLGPFAALGLPLLLLTISSTYVTGLYGGLSIAALAVLVYGDAQFSTLPGIVLSTGLRLVVFFAVAILTELVVHRTNLLRQKTEELEHEIAVRNEYTAVVVHELRNPLISIRTAAQVLPKHAEPERLAEGIRDEASAGLALLDAMTEAASVESGRLRSLLRPMDLTEAIRIATEIHEGGGRLRIVGLDHPLAVLGDPDRLSQVVKNLLSNAIKYSPPNAPIEIAAGVSADAQTAIVSVRDYGAGIPPAERPHLFRKFKRLSSAGPTRGSGLGLYICQQIVRDHGGTLEANWPSGGGTRFSFTVPLR